jgi:hypothetical protein
MKSISQFTITTLILTIALILVNFLFISNANAGTVEWIMKVQKEHHMKPNKEVAERIVNGVYTSALKHNVDPELLFKVIYIESKFNPKSISKEGASGLTQVIPRYHRAKIKGRDIFNLEVNIDVGTQAYAEYAKKYPTTELALNAYNGRLKHNPYAKQVLSVKIPDTQADNAPVLASVENSEQVSSTVTLGVAIANNLA